MRLLAAAIPRRSWIVMLLFVVASGVLSAQIAWSPVSSALNCRADWEKAIAHREAGNSTYSGVCAHYGFPDDGADVPTEFQEYVDQFGESAQLFANSLLGSDLSTGFALTIGSVPIIVLAMALGAMVGGRLVEGDLAAWLVGSGKRVVDLVSRATATAWLATLGAVFVLGLIYVIGLLVMSSNSELLVPFEPAITTDLLYVLPGLAWYSALGTAAGVAFARSDIGLRFALLAIVVEFALVVALPEVPVLPAGLLAEALPQTGGMRLWLQPSYGIDPFAAAALLITLAFGVIAGLMIWMRHSDRWTGTRTL